MTTPTARVTYDPAVTCAYVDTAEGRAALAWPGTPTGARCLVAVALKPAADGSLRCAWHDPARRAARLARADERKASSGAVVRPEDLPVAAIDSVDDALALARWLPIAIATGRIGGREALAFVSALREYRMIAADVDARARLVALEERIAAARKKGLDI